jgi:hypothetical protein
MKKQLYNTPKVELTPVSLSACIMSGGGSVPAGVPPYTNPSGKGPYEARKRVF